MSRNSSILEEESQSLVAPREGRVSRNYHSDRRLKSSAIVAPREGRVSRNLNSLTLTRVCQVAPREGRVSRNF